VKPDHAIMRGVPSSFTVEDELYRFLPDTAGPSVTVLATAREEATGRVYPIVWTVQHSNGRIIVNTLGHDGVAHAHPAYQRILQNSLRWAGRQVR
jgi:type 1 glutamine amidotransferase